MKACKYFLPCGYCDKYNVPCKSTRDGLIDYNVLIGEISSEQAEEIKAACHKYDNREHEWRYKGENADKHIYECIKCGFAKTVPLESLSSTDKECNHEWFCEEVWHFRNDIGKQINRARFVCRLCGAKVTNDI